MTNLSKTELKIAMAVVKLLAKNKCNVLSAMRILGAVAHVVLNYWIEQLPIGEKERMNS